GMGRVDEIRSLRSEVVRSSAALLPSLIESQIKNAWPTLSLEQITTDIRNGWSGKSNDRGREVGVLRLSCVHGMTVNLLDTKPVKLDVDSIEAFNVKYDDVFVVRGNGSRHLVGRSAIAAESNPQVVFNDLLIRLTFKHGIVPRFANYVLHSSKVREQ